MLVGNMIRIIDFATAARGLFKDHNNVITDIRLQSHQDNILASADADGNLFIWRVVLPTVDKNTDLQSLKVL
jgi:hypothetical protein